MALVGRKRRGQVHHDEGADRDLHRVMPVRCCGWAKRPPLTARNPPRKPGIGIIHQELNLIPQLTIAENIFLGREFVNRFGKIDWKTDVCRSRQAVGKAESPLYQPDNLVGELSIGDQQMVEIAKVLSFESKVIIMDEPTDALTDTETESLFRVIRELKSQGRGIVYISHRMKEIFEICDDVTVFRDGQFIAEREVSSLDRGPTYRDDGRP